MSDKELLEKINIELTFQENITEEEISNRAYEQIKSMKHTLPDKLLEYKNTDKKIIFMAGSPGAGKTETAQLLKQRFRIDSVDTDDIRKLCDGFSGVNSHLYQRASSRGVSILTNYAFKNGLSFILDGNFADYDMQIKNINRALKRDYTIEINYIYRPLQIAKRYTQIREARSGRKVPDDVFIKKSLGAIETINKVIDEIKVNFYDLTKNIITENISKEQFNNKVKNDIQILRRG
jgi:predicted ABC-type ATPase